MARPEIWVLVPTRERAEVLGACLETLVSQPYEHLRVLVSDNASTDHTREVVESFDDPRLHYVNTGRRVSMSANWEHALARVPDGAWVGYLGDDDGFLPGAIGQVAEALEATGADALRGRVAFYLWPGVRDNPHGVITWKRRYRVVPGRLRFEASGRLLRQVLCGVRSYMDAMSVYVGGFVRVSVLRGAMREGRFFHSMIPDVYASLAILKRVERVCHLDAVLALNGASRHSTGMSAFSARSRERETGQRFFEEDNLPFHPLVPTAADGRPPRSIPALIYESHLQTLPLGDAGGPCADPVYQLVRILDAWPDPAVPEAWKARFLERHGLSPEAVARRQARALRRMTRMRLFESLLRMSRSFRITGDAERPLATVDAAARALAERLSR